MASSSVPEASAPPDHGSARGLLAIVADHAAAAGRQASTVLVLDGAWTPMDADEHEDDGPRLVGVRDLAEAVLADRDLIEETSTRLDAWAAATGVVDALTIDTTSFWYYVRLRHWLWLQERILWVLILDEALRRHRPSGLVAAPGLDPALLDVLPLLAARDGLDLEMEPDRDVQQIDAAAAALPAAAVRPASTAAPPPPAPLPRRLARGVRRRINALLGRTPPPTPVEVRLAATRQRLEGLSADSGRLLVVRQHDQQRVDTPDGPRDMNPYLDPILDRLCGTALEPVSIAMRARVKRDADWARLQECGNQRELPLDALLLDPVELGEADLGWVPPVVSVPLAGLDLGPMLAADVVASAHDWLPKMRRSVERIERLLRTLRPAAVLLADEYHRQDWLAAARRVRVPVAAVQHGLIYPRHNGYMHPDRPAGLHLADRTYVFGRWERDLLVDRSVYRPDEVVVGGSVRLDLVRDDPAAARALRRDLGVRDDEVLLLLSGTWGRIDRRFHYPIALARLFDRPVPGVHLVVKLHPGERDDGPYRAIVEGAAAAGGFAPPPITIVRNVDLYRLLAAADAHLGIRSTVLTEAVATRTRNLLADQLRAGDLLGYVETGVAIPVRDGGDLVRALDPATQGASEEAAAAFVAAHFEPGAAAARIADDLRAWLA